ncbi:molybdenum cofactor sulfurase [Cladorrhinum sp. PSN259]|nr:molybdenum cofactor sulfurase [Cladorrhinum sp. PSN259]
MSITDLFPEYATTSSIDVLREAEYSHLDTQDHVYLDYTGSGLASQSQHLHHASRLQSTLYGNPHSINPTSQAATEEINATRSRILSYLNASPDEYAVIFTPNATGAARLVGESYPFRPSQRLVLTADNHNSINGIRVMAASKGTRTTYIPLETPSLRLDTNKVITALSSSGPSRILSNARGLLKRVITGCMPHRSQALPALSQEEKPRIPAGASSESHERKKKGLFAYPAQSNFSGVRHSLSLVSLAQQKGYDVLLDAAAYLPTSALDLSVIKPEFVTVSFYKLFGYPTGVGCLVAKKSALSRLADRPWFSGGTIQAVTVGIQWHQMLSSESPEKYEDGTVNFASIPDVKFGLDWISRVGMQVISTRVQCLTGWVLLRLGEMKHSDGRRMIRIYGPSLENVKMRGGTVSFNILDAEGKVVDERIVALESAAARISLRTGCFCNPGVGEYALGITKKKLRRLARNTTEGRLNGGLDRFIELLELPSAGAVRVSFGIASNAADVDRFFGFLEKTYKDRVTTSDGLDPRESC